MNWHSKTFSRTFVVTDVMVHFGLNALFLLDCPLLCFFFAGTFLNTKAAISVTQMLLVVANAKCLQKQIYCESTLNLL